MATSTNGKTEVRQDLDGPIAELVYEIRAAQEHAALLQTEIDEAKNELRALLEQRGSNWLDNVGYARLASEGVRLTYDTRALDDLIIKDPLRYGWLKDYRLTSVVRR